ncbi:hypothetical protein [Alkalicoccus chagannorensis]|uniref:hypothetical protein n=1 Tax=Alkalicoccus chagannorensis TaxID=427072 RepID=UPI00040B2406|nr:hypothetical protein [Alkalicoccus chagannorensis]
MTPMDLVLYVMPLLSFLTALASGFVLRNQWITLLSLPLTMVLLHSVVIFAVFQMAYTHWLIVLIMTAGMVMVPAAMVGEALSKRYPFTRKKNAYQPYR